MTPDQIQWLTWGAIQHRPYGAPRWDEPGTAKAIADHCGTWGLDVATEHVLAHARDAKAKTPFVIKGNPPHTEPTKAHRQPAKAGGDECPMHPGEYATSCRSCAADRLAGDESSIPRRQKPPAEVSKRGAAACRAAMGLPEPSPAPDVSASVEPPAPPVPSGADEGDVHGPASAGEPDRPEQACTADGCFRPTRDGICDRCREQAITDDRLAANAALVDRLKANERERAHTRPAPDPEPRHFTADDIDHDRVRAAMSARTEGSTT